MNWYQGNIAEAVALSKSKNAIFVVFVEGEDENSEKMGSFIDDPRINTKLQSEHFVAIKIVAGGPEYMQFAAIYKMVPIPSMFFIGKSGAPLFVGTAIIKDAAQLNKELDKVLLEAGIKIEASPLPEAPAAAAPAAAVPAAVVPAVVVPDATVPAAAVPAAAASTSFIAAEQQQQEATSLSKTPSVDKKIESIVKNDESAEIVCENGVCQMRQTGGEAEPIPEYVSADSFGDESYESQTIKPNDDPSSISMPLPSEVAMRRLLEEKRRERIEMELQEERNQELIRRREMLEWQKCQNWQRENELRELKDSLRRDRLADMNTRERIKAQIAADRAEWAERLANEAAAKAAATAAAALQAEVEQAQQYEEDELSGNIEEITRLQFRLSNGTTKTHSFNSLKTLGDVRSFVKAELLPGTGIKNFFLSTTFPKRDLTTEQDDQTLMTLGLHPNSHILVIGKEGISPSTVIQRSGGLINIFTSIVMALLSPFVAIYGFFCKLRRGSETNEGNAEASGARKRENEEPSVQQDAAKRRNLDRLIAGSTASNIYGDNQPESSTSRRYESNDESKAYRRYNVGSNIHRLTDNSGKDSDDENATWNGNSTQQQ